MEVTYSENEIKQVAKQLLNYSDLTTWIFKGEMGAGKTTMIKSLCKLLGVMDEMSSPTFSIINEYSTKDSGTIYHFDFYRLERQEEAFDIGVEDYFFSGERCFIEWPELIVELLPDNYLEISIKLVDDNTRHLIAKSNGPTL
ncbi:MAG: tRNA (adenosine(37)-N6)-threonylcarbamoyltransferase complex ATPase subunit type 1 TsaE [Cyclobacteriaceae bacterium]